MKTTKTKRPVSRSVHLKAKQTIKKARPLHKRFLLHPFTVMVLLCVGVLIVGMTVRTMADSIIVSAKVSAAPPTEPATIESPTDNLHVQTAIQAVSGSCPLQTYVTATVNHVFAGSAPCTSSQKYSLPVTLSEGANVIVVQDYNLTDDAGPPTPPITVYYDHVTSTPPSDNTPPPTTLVVTGLDGNSYSSGSDTVWLTSDRPTISGFAPPFSRITVTFHSVLAVCQTVANSRGFWSCTLDQPLPLGVHHVDITAVTPDGKVLVFPTITIDVVAYLSNLLSSTASVPRLSVDHAYEARTPGQDTTWVMSIAGGTAPYTVNVDWDDGNGNGQEYSSGAPFTLVHSYHTSRTYLISVTVTDAKGGLSVTQLVATIGQTVATTTNVVKGGNLLSQLMGGAKNTLWLIWSGYIVVLLMMVGYYLGEREEYRLLTTRKVAHARPGARARHR
ncbi:MAG TPA: hypothetical protein VLH84_05980 [Patescibacteria group bacterium]|nr:hypothetical protein [Patescibacteria group bacterium]